MTNEDPRRAGGCRCGHIRIEVSADPLITMACHCKGCQRMSASAFSLSALYNDSDFTIIRGEPVIGGLRGGDIKHYFCAECMSWLFTRPAAFPGFVNLRATMMDDCSAYAPFAETQTAEKLPWAVTGAVHSYARFPREEEFPALLAAFAKAGKAH